MSASKNNFLPFRGKVLMTVFSLTAVLVRLSAILIYFAPSFGLMNLLMHWIMGQKDADANILFDVIDKEDKKFEAIWRKTTHYTYYTIFSLKTYYIALIFFASIHLILVYFLKKMFSDGFVKSGNHFEKFHHVLTQLYIPTNFRDWDSYEITSEYFHTFSADLVQFKPLFEFSNT